MSSELGVPDRLIWAATELQLHDGLDEVSSPFSMNGFLTPLSGLFYILIHRRFINWSTVGRGGLPGLLLRTYVHGYLQLLILSESLPQTLLALGLLFLLLCGGIQGIMLAMNLIIRVFLLTQVLGVLLGIALIVPITRDIKEMRRTSEQVLRGEQLYPLRGVPSLLLLIKLGLTHLMESRNPMETAQYLLYYSKDYRSTKLAISCILSCMPFKVTWLIGDWMGKCLDLGEAVNISLRGDRALKFLRELKRLQLSTPVDELIIVIRSDEPDKELQRALLLLDELNQGEGLYKELSVVVITEDLKEGLISLVRELSDKAVLIEL